MHAITECTQIEGMPIIHFQRVGTFLYNWRFTTNLVQPGLVPRKLDSESMQYQHLTNSKRVTSGLNSSVNIWFTEY